MEAAPYLLEQEGEGEEGDEFFIILPRARFATTVLLIVRVVFLSGNCAALARTPPTPILFPPNCIKVDDCDPVSYFVGLLRTFPTEKDWHNHSS